MHRRGKDRENKDREAVESREQLEMGREGEE